MEYLAFIIPSSDSFWAKSWRGGISLPSFKSGQRRGRCWPRRYGSSPTTTGPHRSASRARGSSPIP